MTQVRYESPSDREQGVRQRCAAISLLSPFTPFNAAPPRICMICGCCRCARYSMTRGLRQPVGSDRQLTPLQPAFQLTPLRNVVGAGAEKIVWVETDPIFINDISHKDSFGCKYELKCFFFQ